MRLIIFAIVQELSQLVEERNLPAINPALRFLGIEPGSAVDLCETLALARSWRPLGFEFIALQPGLVNVAFDGPGMDRLAAWLQARGQRKELAIDHCPDLFGEFSTRCREAILTGIELALRDGPGAEILPRPERPAGMNEKDLKHAMPLPVDQQSRALPGHMTQCSAD